jgi:NADH-quinone oxidoreductase subunit I
MEFAAEDRKTLVYDKNRLVNNGDKLEPTLAERLKRDAEYR